MTNTLLQLALESSLRVTAVAGLVALVLVAGRVRSTTVRHRVWVAVLVSMMLMPVLPYWVPAVAVPVPQPAVRSMDALSQSVAPLDPPAYAIETPVSNASVRMAAVPGEVLQAQAPAPRADVAGGAAWPAAVIAVYALGFVLLASRLLIGWRHARRLVASDNEHRSSDIDVSESALAATPLTVGILAPRIVLPPSSRAWSEGKLQAVLAHERAHIARRDPLVAFLAAVNRCVFWFHPIAWWLERKLAAMAEHACDEAAVRELGESRRAAYAETLLDMAEAARRAGGRLAWQGVGVVDGASLIARRIDRILNGRLGREMSPMRKAGVALASAAAIFIGVACHERRDVERRDVERRDVERRDVERRDVERRDVPPLKEDPEITARFAVQQAQGEFHKKVTAMSRSDIDALEARWEKNSEDLEAVKTLLAAYEPARFGLPESNQEFALRRRHIMLWLIGQHPDHYLAARSAWTIGASDDIGRDQALRLWQQAIAKPDATVKTLSNAAAFFSTVDRALAEQTLLRAQAKEPGGGSWVVADYLGISGTWTSRLADLYARALSGEKVGLLIGEFDLSTFNGSFAQGVRRKLDDSKDAALLARVASDLARWTTRPEPSTSVFNPWALKEKYAKRALELDPNQAMAHQALATVRRYETNQRRIRVLGYFGFWDTASHAAKVAALSPADRFAVLADLADSAYMAAEYNDFESKRQDAEYPNKWFKTREEREQAALSAWTQSKQFAREALDLAPQFKDAPNYSSSIYRANIVLGLHALRAGDVKTAVRGMQAALAAPPSEQLAYDQTGSLDWRLTSYLLNCGERDSVAEFFERSAPLVLRDSDQRLKDAAAIRRGQMPMSYQYMVTPHEWDGRR